MNPLKLLSDLVHDYAYVARRQYDVLRSGAKPATYLAGTKRPVVILPGIYEDWRFMLPLVERLSASGHPVHVVPELRHNRDVITDSAVLVAGMLEQRDLRDVVIVAHSKGGLIGKQVLIDDAAAQATGGPVRVAHLVAINTPFAGSAYARYAIRRELREFSPTDALLKRFATILDINERITSIFSTVDPVVPDGSLLPGAYRNIRMPFLGHFRILADVRVLAIVDAIAEAPPAVAPAPPRPLVE
ncbi:MAG: alpha/beta hydrolase [Leifsonia flava]